MCLPCGQLSDWGRVSQLEGCGVCACSVVNCQTGGVSPSWRAAVCVPAVWSAVRLGVCLPAGGLRCVCLQCGQLSDWGRVSQLEDCGVCACSVVSCQTGGVSPSWRAAVCVPAVWSTVRLGACLPAGGLRCVCLQCGQLSDWGRVSQLEGCGVCACSVVSCQTGAVSPSWRAAVCVPAVWSAVRLGARLPAGGLRCVCLQCGQLSDLRGRVSALEDALAAVESTARQQLCALASQSEAAIDTAQEKLLHVSSALRQFNKFVGVSVGSAWGQRGVTVGSVQQSDCFFLPWLGETCLK